MAWRPKITVRKAAATAIRRQKPVDGHMSNRPTCLTTVKITAASLLRSQVTEERIGPPLSSTAGRTSSDDSLERCGARL